MSTPAPESRFDALQWLVSRRSVPALSEPGPTEEELAQLVRATLTVPDHGLLRPFRFVAVSGEMRPQFGEALAAAGLECNPGAPPQALDKLRHKALVAPTQLVLIYSPKPSQKIPNWEQKVAASCAGYAVALAAHAIGLGAIWKSSPFIEGAKLRELFAMHAQEELLGWINLGRPARPIDPARSGPAPEGFASVLGPSGLVALGPPEGA